MGISQFGITIMKHQRQLTCKVKGFAELPVLEAQVQKQVDILLWPLAKMADDHDRCACQSKQLHFKPKKQ